MKPRSQAYVFLILALENLKAAKILASSGQVNPQMVGFHLQQAAEKALKADLQEMTALVEKLVRRLSGQSGGK